MKHDQERGGFGKLRGLVGLNSKDEIVLNKRRKDCGVRGKTVGVAQGIQQTGMPKAQSWLLCRKLL